MAAEGSLGIPHVINTGIAFGFLQGSNNLIGVISAAAAALIIFYRGRVSDGIETAAMALILGGTLSNLADRIFRGAVVDYITIGGFPAFNLADAALTAGAALIISSFIIQKCKK